MVINNDNFKVLNEPVVSYSFFRSNLTVLYCQIITCLCYCTLNRYVIAPAPGG